MKNRDERRRSERPQIGRWKRLVVLYNADPHSSLLLILHFLRNNQNKGSRNAAPAPNKLLLVASPFGSTLSTGCLIVSAVSASAPAPSLQLQIVCFYFYFCNLFAIACLHFHIFLQIFSTNSNNIQFIQNSLVHNSICQFFCN